MRTAMHFWKRAYSKANNIYMMGYEEVILSVCLVMRIQNKVAGG